MMMIVSLLFGLPVLLGLVLVGISRLARTAGDNPTKARRRFRQLVWGQMLILSLVYIAVLWGAGSPGFCPPAESPIPAPGCTPGTSTSGTSSKHLTAA
jgi:hypothetical protein